MQALFESDPLENRAIEVCRAVRSTPADGDTCRVIVPVRIHDTVPIRYGHEAVGARRQPCGLLFQRAERLCRDLAGCPLFEKPADGEHAALEVRLDEKRARERAIE